MERFMELISRIKELSGTFTSTLLAFAERSQITPELLLYSNSAINLAFSLLPSGQIAFQIALDAALGVEQIAYKKRRYRLYAKADNPTKVLLGKAQMFQQMIWYESQKWEQYQETDLLLQYLRCCDRQT